MSATDSWKKCSICKSDIGFKIQHWVCNVSTCNGKRTGLIFCSIPCFERHLPGARHKDAYAIEEVSPTASQGASNTNEATRRIIIPSTASSIKNHGDSRNLNTVKEILVVVSKLKEYIQVRSGMNTSAGCMPLLSDIIRRECDKAIENAKQDGRKTLMERDFK